MHALSFFGLALFDFPQSGEQLDIRLKAVRRLIIRAELNKLLQGFAVICAQLHHNFTPGETHDVFRKILIRYAALPEPAQVSRQPSPQHSGQRAPGQVIRQRVIQA